MAEVKKLYTVLRPIAYSGSRFERDEVVALTEDAANNIGSDSVQLVKVAEQVVNGEVEAVVADEGAEVEVVEKPKRRSRKK